MTDTSWYPENYYTDPLPHYKTMPEYLRVEDTFAITLAGEHLKMWRKWRDVGLAQWRLVGFELRIKERPADFGVRAHRVTLRVQPHEYEWPAYGCFGCNPVIAEKDDVCPPCARKGMGWISFDDDTVRRAFLSRNGDYLKYLFAHEFGHCLGFTHGGDGIMDQTPDHAHVNDEEAAAARAYWGL